MINLKNLKNQKGVALPVVLVVMLLLLALGAAAMMMSNLGYSHLASETRYQYADKAADYGINTALEEFIERYTCITSQKSNTIGNSKYTYFGIPDNLLKSCFVYSRGEFGNAKVVKTAIIEQKPPRLAAIITDTCEIQTKTGGGTSGAISGCDSLEQNYEYRCGKVSAVIYNQANISLGVVNRDCEDNNYKGLNGNPPKNQNSELFTDIVAEFFNVSDENSSGSSWDELLGKIERHYTNDLLKRKIEFYDFTKNTQKYGLPISPPESPDTVCNPTFNGNPICCKTTSENEITCYSNSDCSNGPLTPKINLDNCKSNPKNYPYILADDNTVAYIKINNPVGTVNKIVPSTDWQITQNNVRLALVDNVPAGPANQGIKIQSSISGVRIYTGGNVTINSNLSAGDRDSGSIIYAGGNVTINANIGNHGIDNSCTNNLPSSTHIISAGDIIFNKKGITIKNTNFFSNSIQVKDDVVIQGGAARIIYALNSLTVEKKGVLGEYYYPVLVLVGDGDPYSTKASFSVVSGGNLELNGLFLTNSTNFNITGNIKSRGMIINMSKVNNCQIIFSGNAEIRFNKQILDDIFYSFCPESNGGILKKPICGGGIKQGYLSSTKITVY